MKNLNIDTFRKGMEITKKNKLYFDHAAMSPLHETVVERIANFHKFRQQEGSDFIKWWRLVEETRELVGDWVHAEPKQIGFLWNTSAGINLAAKGFPLKKGDEIIITDEEFPSNVYPWFNVAKERHLNVKTVKHQNHYIDADIIINKVSDRTKLISVSWVNATNGNKLDIKKLGEFCRDQGIYLVIDAMQGLGTDDLDLKDVYADLVVSGFFKWLMGPDGLSFIYLSERALENMDTPWIGWAGMENKFNYEIIDYAPVQAASRFETGNMNFSAIAGINEVLKQLLPIRGAINQRVTLLTKILRTGLKEISEISVKSSEKNISGITLFTGREKKIYDQRDIIINYRSGLRVSPHFYNTEEEIYTLLNITELGK